MAREADDLLEGWTVRPAHRLPQKPRNEADPLRRGVRPPCGRIRALGGLDLVAGRVDGCPERIDTGGLVAVTAVRQRVVGKVPEDVAVPAGVVGRALVVGVVVTRDESGKAVGERAEDR